MKMERLDLKKFKAFTIENVFSIVGGAEICLKLM
jgi:hypothetical protein